jgi:hypothetical protein
LVPTRVKVAGTMNKMLNKDLFKFISKSDKKNLELNLGALELFKDNLVDGMMWSGDSGEDEENIKRIESMIEQMKEILNTNNTNEK